jgi:hypothetical protein
MELNSLYRKSKRGRSESISGRLRAASDLEEIGWIDKNQKGVIKDLIISGDETLRSALDKYENGDAHDLEGTIYSRSTRSASPDNGYHTTDGLLSCWCSFESFH